MTMFIGGLCFMLGAVLTSAAYYLAQLVVGRVILGFGVGVFCCALPTHPFHPSSNLILTPSCIVPLAWRFCIAPDIT